MNQKEDTMAEGHPQGFTARSMKRNGPAGKRGAPGGQLKPGRAQQGRRRADTPANPKSNFARYQALAQAAARSGDAIQAEYYYQHADHYYRLMAEQAS